MLQENRTHRCEFDICPSENKHNSNPQLREESRSRCGRNEDVSELRVRWKVGGATTHLSDDRAGPYFISTGADRTELGDTAKVLSPVLPCRCMEQEGT